MDEVTALHTAARRYCEARFHEWIHVYEDLQQKESWKIDKLFEPGWDYSEEAYRTFPRYRIAKNTRIEIERIRVDSEMSLPEMRELLFAASAQAEAGLQTELKNKLAQAAIREEAADFRVYVGTLTPSDLVRVKPLPHRRVLGKEESERIWGGVKKAWGIGDGYWFPLKEGMVPSNILPFHTDYFQSINGQTLLRDVLRRHGVSTVFLLHEFGDPNYEIELGIFEPGYRDGGEQFSTSEQADWVVYASHESSITIAGEWLIDEFRRSYPECTELTYRGPYPTSDLCGTWEAS